MSFDDADLTPEQESIASSYAQSILDDLSKMPPIIGVVALLYVHSNYIYDIPCDCKVIRGSIVDELAKCCHMSFAKWDRERDT